MQQYILSQLQQLQAQSLQLQQQLPATATEANEEEVFCALQQHSRAMLATVTAICEATGAA
jgi:hypothetical protein